MSTTRTIQRTPNLGLTLKLRKLTEPPAPACCEPEIGPARCEPEIGPARWWNPATGENDLETLAVNEEYSGTGVSFDGERRTLFHARVTGELCGCSVTWAVAFAYSSESVE